MPSTPSSLLRIQLMGTGDQAGLWGDTTNTNLGTLIEGAIAGLASVSVISANQALTVVDYAADQSRMAIISLSTTTAANFNVYAPPVSKTYIIHNTSAYTATIYNSTVAGNTTAAGLGVTIPAGRIMQVWSNGTNFYKADTAITLSTDVTGTLPVGSGGTGITAFGTGVATALGQNVTGSGGIVLATSPTLTSPTVNTLLTVSGDSSLNGAVVVNEAGADKDFRVEGDTDVNLLFTDASTDRVGIGTDTPQTKAHIQQTSATTNAVTQVFRLDSQSSSTPAVGIGVGMEFAAETSAGNTEVGVVLEAVTTDVTAASEDFDLVFKTMQNGAAAAERVRIRSDGNVGIGTNSPSTILSLSRSSACVAQFANGTATAQVGAFGTNVAAFGSSTNHPTRFLINGNIQAGIETSGAFQFNSGYGSSATAFGCRAWVSFNGTGTPAIRGSGNVSSITDNGTGSYEINFTVSMPDANYAAIVTSEFVSNGVNICFPSLNPNYIPPVLSSSVEVIIQPSGGGGGGAVDATYFNVAIFR